MRSYSILRNLAVAGTNEPFGGGTRGGPTATAISPPEPRIEVHSLDNNQVRDIARDPEVTAIAPIMATTLIKPFELDSAAAAAVNNAWGIAAVKADSSPHTGEGIVVAVLDTGIEANHPAFQGVTIREVDFTGSGNGDRQGHGTHCAGTIFGRDVSGTRIGIARGVTRALIGKVLGDNGGGDSDMIFRGIQWAVQQGAHVISMSLGFDFPGSVRRAEQAGWPTELAVSSVLEAYRANLRMFDALMQMIEAQAAFGSGTLITAAAGNESRRDRDPNFEIAASLPAAAQGVVSVGALQQGANGLSIAPFSNTFPQVSAPGVGILSAALGGGLHPLSGTSMACPHVAGVAALWWEALQTSGMVRATAGSVLARMLGSAGTSGFAPGVDIADRGMGAAIAPQ